MEEDLKKNSNSYHRCEVMTTSLVLGAAKQLKGLPGLDRGSPLLKGKQLRERSASKFYTFLRFNAVSCVVIGAGEGFKINSVSAWFLNAG